MNDPRMFTPWLLRPIRPGRYRGASRATGLLGSVAVTCAVLAVVMLIAMLISPPGWRSTMNEVRADLMSLALLSSLIALAIFVRDIIEKGRAQSQRREEEAFTERRQADAAELAQSSRLLSQDLKSLYVVHHNSLVEEARERLQPDRYGRRDSARAAQEFSYFQDNVVTPELVRRGYSPGHIAEVFAADREALLLTVLQDL